VRAWAAGLPAAVFESGSLSFRLIAAFLLAILITSVATGLPAYWITRAELENQAWGRVEGGLQITEALMDAEGERLGNLAALAAERPTLRGILLGSEDTSLEAYLTSFRANAGLDLLAILDLSGGLRAVSPADVALPNLPVHTTIGFARLPGRDGELVMLATSSIRGESDQAPLGWVLAGVQVDDAFVRRLARSTGLEHSLLMDGARRASSLGEAGLIEGGQAHSLPRGADRRTLEIGGAPFYSTSLALRDEAGLVLGELEVALPVQPLETAEHRAQTSLILSTLGVAVAASFGAALYAARLIRPLRRLTEAAHRISQGDLIQPIAVPPAPLEVATLARALEESRVNTDRSLQELSKQNAWLDTLIGSIAEGIVTVDKSGLITSFSQGAEAITGWSADQAQGRSVEEVLRLADGGELLARLPTSGARLQFEVETRPGRQVTLSITGAELRTPGSSAIHRALVLRETTEEEATQRLRSYFLANISHEFRTPLSAINAALELLLDELGDLSIAEIGDLLDRMHMSVTGLHTLIDNLLESSSIEAGRFTLRRTRSDLTELLQEAVQTLQPLLDRRHQALTMDLMSGLPKLWIDPTRITQVLVNLLSNASKYSPVGATILVRGEPQDGDWVRVEIADRGPGIPAAERQSIFRRFVRLNSDETVQYGIGLGLAVVKAIVEEHGGKVGVEGRTGGGSTFWFSLPQQETRK
jgi:PAS domain S-box-containing protein